MYVPIVCPLGYLTDTGTGTAHSTQVSLLGRKVELEHAQRPYSPVTSLLFRTSGEKTSGAVFPVQLTPCTSR